MAIVRFDGAGYALADGENVLSGLLRHGVSLNHSCRAGVCGSCMMKATAGSIPPRAQSSLKDSWKARGYFMACVCVPDEDLEVAALDAGFRFDATLTSLKPLSGDVIQASLLADSAVDFRAGQYMTVVRSDGLARSYSVASLPSENLIDLHIRRIPNGRMSGWFHDEARKGDRVTLLGPSGECFYVAGREQQPLLLAGTGTGLAPLYGIVRDAIRSGHTGPIHLFHGALHAGGLYLVEELRELASQHAQLRYTPTVLRGEAPEGVVVGALGQTLEQSIPDLTGWRGFLCGDPSLVQDLKRQVFLAGIASRDIYADAFIPAAPAAAPA